MRLVLGVLLMLISFIKPLYADPSLPLGWQQDRILSNDNRLVFKNEQKKASLEIKEIPAEGNSAKAIAQGLANKANCFKIENVNQAYIITCDQLDIFTRVTVKNNIAEITTINCHDQETCKAAIDLLRTIDL